MQMRNGLSAVVAGVYDNAEAIIGDTEFVDEFRDDVNENMRGKVLILVLKLRDVLNMLFRDNQHVDGSFGREVFEGNDALIFVDELGRNFPRGNLTKNTISHTKTSCYKVKTRAVDNRPCSVGGK